jgi:hypothetical protein
MSIDFPRFYRVVSRSGEIVSRGDVVPIVKTVYELTFASLATGFIAAHKAIENAEKALKKERGEGLVALTKIEQPYSEARTAAAIFIKELALPAALGSLTTETDKRDAIARLLEILDAHDDEPGWAKDLTDGAFGQLAPEAIREITEWIAANGDLEKAVRGRAAAYAAAYPAFLDFRSQVRASYGKSSIHYRRLLVRSNGKLVIDDPTDES